MKICDNKIIINKGNIEFTAGTICKSYIRLSRNESNHTIWKWKAWGINAEIVNYAIKNKLDILVVSTHKSGEKANYYIKTKELVNLIGTYECEIEFIGEKQYAIPKTFFHHKRENEACYTNPSYDTNLHTKRFATDANETDSGNRAFIK